MVRSGPAERGGSAPRNAAADRLLPRVSAADLATARWKKSSASSYAGNCVEVAEFASGAVGIRDSKARGAGPVLVVNRTEFRSLLSEIKSGRFWL
jgi:Domain of unknown function (DUF397)